MIFGLETTGSTPHLQGFINFNRKHRFPRVKTMVGIRAHIEKARGTDLDNQRYCSKEKNFFEYGIPQQQGKRSDLRKVAETLKENGGDLSQIANDYPTQFIRYQRGLSAFCDVLNLVPKRDFKTNVTVIVGPSGCGKSRYAYDKDIDAYYKPRGEWWDGYNGQKTVIIDDFYGWLKYDELLRVCDRYPHRVPVKGSFRTFISKEIIITSNKHVESWYSFDDLSALFRRINVYLVFDDALFVERTDTPHPINF